MRTELLFLFIQTTISYKFLVHSPLFGHSHATFLAQIADTLTAAGHHVTFFVPIMDDELVGKKTVSLTKDIITLQSTEEMKKLYTFMRNAMYASVWEMSSDPLAMMSWAKNFSVAWKLTCDDIFKHKTVLDELRERNFDAAIAEPLSICGFALFEYLGIQGTIGAISTVQADVVSYHIGEPLAPSYVPTLMSNADEKLSFLQRAQNLFETMMGFSFLSQMYEGEAQVLRNKFGNNFTSPAVCEQDDSKTFEFQELLAKTSYMFVNSQPYLNFPRPLIHKTVEIGGISVNTKNVVKLEKKWSDILDERKQSVFISFGSVAKSKDMPIEFKNSILSICKQLPNITFIWKYEEKTSMADDIPNLYLAPWLPQNGLLADKRLSLFITHGGLGSTTEVAHFGKASIMVPLFGEQQRNSRMLTRHGGALFMDKKDITNPEKFKNHILTVLNDKSYAENAEKLANVLKLRPISAKELVISHSEFVARFGSLPNLDPHGRHLSIIEYYFIDVVAVAAVVCITVLLSVIICVRQILRTVFGLRKIKLE